MKQTNAHARKWCPFCGRNNLILAQHDKQTICLDCAAAAMRVLSSKDFGEKVNKLKITEVTP